MPVKNWENDISLGVRQHVSEEEDCSVPYKALGPEERVTKSCEGLDICIA